MKKYKSKSKSAIMKHFIVTAIFAAMCQHGTAQTNTPPTITGTPNTRVLEGSNYIFTPIGTDADAGNTLTYSVAGNPSWLTIDTATGALTGKPPYDASESSPYEGIVISVTDDTETVALDSFDIKVVDFNFPTHVASISNGQNADGSANTDVKLRGASNIAILGDYAYVTSNTDNGVEILNISNPEIPVHVAFINNITKLGGASGITVVERTVGGVDKIYAYVTTIGNIHGVTTIDVTNPAVPVITGFIKNGFDADGTTVNANVKFDRPVGITVLGDYAYVSSDNGDSVEILNISTPAVPTHAGSIINGFNADGTTVNAAVKLEGAVNIAVAERTVGGVAKVYAYVVANLDHTITVLDVTTPANPTFLGSITDDNTRSLNFPRSIAVVGDYAYVGSFDEGVSILNISNPASISQVGSIADTSDINLDWANSITVVGNYAYVASVEDDGVAIIDISDPANPVHVGSISDEGTRELEGAYNITVVGNYAYVASFNDNGVEILQISGIVRSGNLILGDQVAIDGLSSSFVKIAGNLMVKETIAGAITSLTGLSNIISVGGNLEIVGNTSLTSLAGLDDLEILEGKLYIGITAAGVSSGNTALVDFCAISNLVTGGASAQITNASATNEYFVGNNGYNPTYAGLGTRSPATTASETDGCTKFGTAVASTNTFSKEEDYRLFPNPVKDILFVKGGSEITSISISNLSGQTVLKGKGGNINVQNLSKGIYFARIVSGEKVVVEKFIKL